jgi:iron complex transport system substrate-binding protein
MPTHCSPSPLLRRRCRCLCLVALLLAAAAGAGPKAGESGVTHAKGLLLERHQGLPLVTVKTPWPGGKPVRYLLVPRGQPVPEVADTTVVHTPVRSVVCMSTTFIAQLSVLDKVDTIVGVDRKRYVYSPEVRRMIAAGTVAEVGGDRTIDLERALAIKPDLVLTFGLDDSLAGTYRQLARAGVTTVFSADYLEPTPLGRCEWIRFFGLLFGAEQRANIYFAEVVKEYTALKQLTRDVKKRPTVLLNSPFKGTWYVPGGASYTACTLADAGGTYLWADDRKPGVLTVAFESVLAKGASADVWLNPGTWKTLADGRAVDERFALFAPFRAGRVYNYVGRTTEQGGNDFWESAAVRPHDVLRDLIRIFHPALLPEHQLFWYRKLP